MPEWTDVAGLNYNNPALREYMITHDEILDANMRRGRLPLRRGLDGADGFLGSRRAPNSNSVKPDIMMLAEASKPDLLVEGV